MCSIAKEVTACLKSLITTLDNILEDIREQSMWKSVCTVAVLFNPAHINILVNTTNIYAAAITDPCSM